MTSHDNKRLIQEAFDKLESGDTRPYLDLLAEDIRWTVIGTTKWSGTYRGKQELIARLLRPVSALIGPRPKFKIARQVSEGDMLVVEFRGENTTTAGKPYHNTYCWVCRCDGGKLKEVTEYADTELFASVLTDSGSPASPQAG